MASATSFALCAAVFGFSFITYLLTAFHLCCCWQALSWVVATILTSVAGMQLAVGHGHKKMKYASKHPDHQGQFQGNVGI